jgi:hypothetical protein
VPATTPVENEATSCLVSMTSSESEIKSVVSIPYECGSPADFDINDASVTFPDFSKIKSMTFNIPKDAYENDRTDATAKQLKDDFVFNPFQLISRKSMQIRDSTLIESLSFNAVELSVECKNLCRMDLFARNESFAVVMMAGMEHGQWDELDRTETVLESRSPRFVKKIRIPAGTQVDRDAQYRVVLYNNNPNIKELRDMEFLGSAEFTIAGLLKEAQHSTEKEILSPRSGRSKGTIVVSLDMVMHMSTVEQVTFDFGFTETAPVRNRICFVVSRALRKGRFSPVYRSEVQTKESLSKFDDVTLRSQDLHGGDERRLFRIEVYRFYLSGKTSLLGFVQTSLEKIKSMPPGTELYWWPALSGFPHVRVKVVSAKLDVGDKSCWFCVRMTG